MPEFGWFVWFVIGTSIFFAVAFIIFIIIFIRIKRNEFKTASYYEGRDYSVPASDVEKIFIDRLYNKFETNKKSFESLEFSNTLPVIDTVRRRIVKLKRILSVYDKTSKNTRYNKKEKQYVKNYPIFELEKMIKYWEEQLNKLRNDIPFV